MLCFNREFVIYYIMGMLRSFERYFITAVATILRYYWIELSTIEREIRKESVSYNTECKILRVICNDSKH